MIGRTISHYKIIKELGRGGMGVVYKAEDTRLKRTIALKFLPSELTRDQEAKERFIQEAQAAAALDHPSICTVHEIDEAEGKTFIAMSFIKGQSLKGKISSCPLEIDEALDIAIQVAEGLQEAHEKEIVHRDIKSTNIMLTEKGQAKIMDFGLAKLSWGANMTRTATIMGTVSYMSPEQARGEKVDQRSDIYSLGVILYEMVTGRVPFEGDTPFTIGVKHKSEIPKDPKELNTQLPEDLNLTILRCLEKDREKRYQSAGEVRAELTMIEKGIPTTEKVISKKEPITSKEITVSFSLKKLFIPALVVVALSIIVVVIWQLLSKKEGVPIEPSKPSIAVLPFTDLSPQKDQEYLSDGMTESVINSLSQLPSIKKVIARSSVFRYKGKEIDPQIV